MSDRDPILAALARLEAGQADMSGRLARLEIGQSRMESEQARLRGELNDKLERILNRLTAIERDALNTKSFLLNDAVISGGRWFDLEARVTKLEDGKS